MHALNGGALKLDVLSRQGQGSEMDATTLTLRSKSHFTRVPDIPRDHVESTPSSCPNFDLLGLPSNS